MYHGKMTGHIYNIWSLAYRTHSLVFVRNRNDLLCVLFSYNASSYIFSIIVSYQFYLSKSSARPSDLNVAIEKGIIIGIQSGYRDDTGRIQSGYREDTVRIQAEGGRWRRRREGGGGGGREEGGGGGGGGGREEEGGRRRRRRWRRREGGRRKEEGGREVDEEEGGGRRRRKRKRRRRKYIRIPVSQA